MGSLLRVTSAAKGIFSDERSGFILQKIRIFVGEHLWLRGGPLLPAGVQPPSTRLFVVMQLWFAFVERILTNAFLRLLQRGRDVVLIDIVVVKFVGRKSCRVLAEGEVLRNFVVVGDRGTLRQRQEDFRVARLSFNELGWDPDHRTSVNLMSAERMVE